jgi:8-oxo-dGTP pyrophosphatase MutT (NUDIX family)
MPSAVLVLLFEESEEWSFFLMERSHAVEYHRGQISLPGGAKEQGEFSGRNGP